MSYAITFDLDTETLKSAYQNESWNSAYGDIRRVLEQMGFSWQQGSVYFGSETVNAVQCVVAVQRLGREYPWFKSSVRDIRMLRIEEMNDLAVALP